MSDNLILRTVRRANRNMLILCLVGFAVLIGAAVLSYPYLYNFFLGPFDITSQEVLNISDINTRTEYFVTITGDDVFDTGYQYVTTSSGGSETVEASYPALLLGERLLLVETPSETAVTTYTGALVSIRPEIRTNVINDIERDYPELKDVFLPIMLDARDFRTGGYIGLGIGAVVAVLAGWGMFNALRRSSDPTKHPIMRALKRFGDPQTIADEIENELIMSEPLNGQARLTRSWLIYSASATLRATRLKDIAWIYKKTIQHRTYGIPVRKTFSALIWDRHGVCITIPGKEQQVNETLETIHQAAPWTVAGYSKELDSAWKSNREAFIAEVDHRQQGSRP